MSEREGRGRMGPVRDPAQAIAMAKCWLATWMKRAGPIGGVTVDHPDTCGFCEMPRDLVIQMLEEFQAWSGIDGRDSDGVPLPPGAERPLKLEIEAWETIPVSEQVLRVRRAQGYLQPDRGREDNDRRSPW